MSAPLPHIPTHFQKAVDTLDLLPAYRVVMVHIGQNFDNVLFSHITMLASINFVLILLLQKKMCVPSYSQLQNTTLVFLCQMISFYPYYKSAVRERYDQVLLGR